MILHKDFRTEHQDLIAPRYIQLSKRDTVEDMFDKIYRIVQQYVQLPEKNMRLFLKPSDSNNKDLFDLMNSFMDNIKSYKMNGEEIVDRSVLIEVMTINKIRILLMLLRIC